MRFHSKRHKNNHHTIATSGDADSANDPIASEEFPFKGDFYLDGNVKAISAEFSQALQNLTVNNLTVISQIPSLSVGTLTVSNFAANTNGSNLINIAASTLDGYSGVDFVLVNTGNENGGYASLDDIGKLDISVIPSNINLSSLNFLEINEYLITNNLSSTVAPLLTSDNVYGYELPDEFLPSHITELSSINGIDLGDYLISADIGVTVQGFRTPTTTVTTTTYTVLLTDSVLLVDDTTAAAIVTITLPPVATAGDGFNIVVMKVGNSFDVIIDGNGAETINGAATQSLIAQYESIKLITNGTTWFIIEA